MNSKEHDKIINNKRKELEDAGHKVIRLDSGYLPDLISIDWETREVEAIEIETKTNKKRVYFKVDDGWQRSAKHNRKDFNATTVIIPRNGKGRTFYLPSQYYEALRLKEIGLTKSEISSKLGIPKVTLNSWFNGTKPWSVQKEYDETLGVIKFDYYQK